MIADWRLPTADLLLVKLARQGGDQHQREAPIGNRQLTIGNNKGPALNNAEPSKLLRIRLAELFSGLFYVAASRLNSPRQLVKAY